MVLAWHCGDFFIGFICCFWGLGTFIAICNYSPPYRDRLGVGLHSFFTTSAALMWLTFHILWLMVRRVTATTMRMERKR